MIPFRFCFQSAVDEKGITTFKWPHGEKGDGLNIQRNTNSLQDTQPSCSNDIRLADRRITSSIVSSSYNLCFK